VNTGEPYTPLPTSSTAAPAAPPGDLLVADASDYAGQVDGRTAYYFASPSGRWQCAIIPRERAGCQTAAQAALGITGAPAAVTDAAGEQVVPNAIVVDRTAEVQFLAVDEPGFSAVPGPAAVLQFNQTLIVAGFRCNIQEQTGVACLSELSGKGFTFSAEGFTPQYSPVPVGAPPPQPTG
jgi:hypothetical protein